MTLRCQVVLQHANGLPRDAVTNTFWVSPGIQAETVENAEQCAEIVREFYVGTPNGDTGPMMSHLSESIADTGHLIKVAPINPVTGVDSRGLGFPPLHVEPFDLVGRGSDPTPMAAEVAVCLSYKSDETPTVPPARRRGRIYFGPITGSSTQWDGNILRPHVNLMNRLARAGATLRGALAVAGFEWVIYSRPYEGRGVVPRPGHSRGDLPAIPARPGALYRVDDVWVDNALDTVRSRGEKPTARTIL